MNKTLFVLLFAAVSNAAVLGADSGAPPAGDGPSGCCDWPSCYDERTGLCLDTCLGTWAQCPAKLFLMNCYSQYLSPFGKLLGLVAWQPCNSELYFPVVGSLNKCTSLVL